MLMSVKERVEAIVARANATYQGKSLQYMDAFDEITNRCLCALEASTMPSYAYISIPDSIFNRCSYTPDVLCQELERTFMKKILVNHTQCNGILELSLRVRG